MSVIIRFPKSRPLTMLERRALAKERFFNDKNWRRAKDDGRSFIWIGNHWVTVFERVNGGWSWGCGVRISWYPPTWSQKVYDSFEVARRKAWSTFMHRFEEDDDPLGIGGSRLEKAHDIGEPA